MQNVLGVILDVDGVLKYQGRVYPGAIETIAALRQRGLQLRFLTNSTLSSRASLTARLLEYGFQISAGEVITASSATAEYLRSLKPRSAWVMVEREGLDEFKEFSQEEDNPEVVVIGDNRSRFDFENLNRALRLVMKGAKLIGMQAEMLDHSMGELELNVGSWVGMLERASGAPAVYIGKPSAFVFELALKSMRLPKSAVIMVGDRLETDILGAKESGLRSVLVRTGEFDESHLAGEIVPDAVIDSIEELLKLL
jgi:HAD superfamily hydrolase (TIGR01458 family)